MAINSFPIETTTVDISSIADNVALAEQYKDESEAAKDEANTSAELAETYAGTQYRAESVSGLPDPTTQTVGDGGYVSGSGDDAVDGVYEVQDNGSGNEWVRVGNTGLAGKADKDTTDPVTDIFDFTTVPSTSGYVYAILNAAKDKVIFGLTKSGNIVSSTISSMKARTSALESLTTFNILPALRQTTDIVCIGDSLTQGTGTTSSTYTYPRQLMSLFGDLRAVSNRGIGGQDGQQIAARFNGEHVTLSVGGNEIPASGTFSITDVTPDVARYGTLSNSVDGWIEHTGGYEHVTLSRTGGGVYTATRTNAGDPLPCLSSTRFISDVRVVYDRIWVMWPDRNTDMTVEGASEAAIARIERMVEAIPTATKRFIILDRLNNALEPAGSEAHTACVEHNAALARRWPMNVIPVRDTLIQQGLDMAGITPTAQDSLDIADDIIPDSLRSDSTHLNNYGYYVPAKLVYDTINFLEGTQWQ